MRKSAHISTKEALSGKIRAKPIPNPSPQKLKPLKPLLVTFLCLFALTFSLQAELTKEEILRAEGIRTYDIPIHLQSKEWLIQEFGPGKKYPINLTLATKNIVWQVREQIRKGEIEPIQGIIRTFWYTHIKPVFARTGSLVDDKTQYRILHQVLVDLVRERDIMRYKDMGFLNNNAGTVKIDKNWHVLLIGEKHGKYAVLEKIAKDLNCTILTLGGQPSLLSMEYLADDYKEKNIDIRKSMYLIFVVDYDPAGWIIRDSVTRNLKFYGMKNIKSIDIILPGILTEEEIELAKFPLPKGKEVINKNWLKKTGGIHGTAYGFESDSVPFERLRQKIIGVATPYVGDPEIIRRANTVEELWQSLNQLIQIILGLSTE